MRRVAWQGHSLLLAAALARRRRSDCIGWWPRLDCKFLLLIAAKVRKRKIYLLSVTFNTFAVGFACVVLVELPNFFTYQVVNIAVPANSLNWFLFSCFLKHLFLAKKSLRIEYCAEEKKLTTYKSGWAASFPCVFWPAASFDETFVGSRAFHLRALWRYIF